MNRSAERTPDTAATAVAVGVVLLTSTTFSAVLADWRWFPVAALTSIAVAGTGAAARMARARSWAPPAQLLVLVVMLTALFGRNAILGVLPGPTTVDRLWSLLGTAIGVVRTGVPPVPADSAMQCLVVLGLGVVTFLVDRIVVAHRAPAVAGLVLLCMLAVPASLADLLLPWWSFLGSAVGFAALLLLGRHPGLVRRTTYTSAVAPALLPVTVVATAAVIALLAGTVFTGVGTRGRIPGTDQEPRGPGTGEIGLRPFTSLRGQLSRDEVVELFRVEGLPRNAYLRAMTLRRFDPDQGWKLDGLSRGVAMDGRLPTPAGVQPSETDTTSVRIDPVGYRDAWLPMFGVPVEVSEIGTGWRYDPASGTAFTRENPDTDSYTELAAFPDPSERTLRRASGEDTVSPAYSSTAGIPPRVRELARRITSEQHNRFDRAVALQRYFTDPSNGFTYDLRTAPASSDDALTDFLFRGKRGYCEQFASAMAVLLRSVGIPSRVAVGFTPGERSGNQRVITTEDAHAWVEAFFPGHGWITFDPTPLSDDRAPTPSYLGSEDRGQQGGQDSETSGTTPEPTPSDGAPTTRPDESGSPSPVARNERTPIGLWLLPSTAVLLLVGGVAAPALIRSARRRSRLSRVAADAPGATRLAWRELLDEFTDRGTPPIPSESPRGTSERLIGQYGLDEESARAVRRLTAEIERALYAPQGDAGVSTAELTTAVEGLRRSRPLTRGEWMFPRSVVSGRGQR
ncbi:transglutaminase TgpA family protein [Actinopolyspora saharensis]|uniref:Transglutaminase-like domain-containing protein n=1 Tax=Actinopolyspora saharensis TaxID=995062 RepID=A0A1H1ATQ1_9ACTN|nr:DUF3488 and transglutaminase-like domain-containing protein [Actinopolyspora saharensis]SDQ43002.1 protein of unknown function [Actinopolyspora saharensis]